MGTQLLKGYYSKFKQTNCRDWRAAKQRFSGLLITEARARTRALSLSFQQQYAHLHIAPSMYFYSVQEHSPPKEKWTARAVNTMKQKHKGKRAEKQKLISNSTEQLPGANSVTFDWTWLVKHPTINP